jgi:hypothetical protein
MEFAMNMKHLEAENDILRTRYEDACAQLVKMHNMIDTLDRQIVVLQEALEYIRDKCKSDPHGWGAAKAKEALTATQDLSGLVLCDAEPVAWMRKWASDKEVPAKVKGDNGRWYWPRQFKILPLTEAKWFADDVPIYKARKP